MLPVFTVASDQILLLISLRAPIWMVFRILEIIIMMPIAITCTYRRWSEVWLRMWVKSSPHSIGQYTCIPQRPQILYPESEVMVMGLSFSLVLHVSYCFKIIVECKIEILSRFTWQFALNDRTSWHGESSSSLAPPIFRFYDIVLT